MACEFGVVKFFRSDLGYGFVYSDQGGEVFLHRKQIIPGVTLQNGWRVKYEPKRDAVRGYAVGKQRAAGDLRRAPSHPIKRIWGLIVR